MAEEEVEAHKTQVIGKMVAAVELVDIEKDEQVMIVFQFHQEMAQHQ